jgi:hypothetical protein
VPPELVIVEDEVVAVRLAGQDFPCEPETGEAIIPKRRLTGFRLSEIPGDVVIKPVESIAKEYIEVANDIGLSPFADGSATAFIEVVRRREFWDGEVGLSPYMTAFRQAIGEQAAAEEPDFQDDGDYIFLYYAMTIPEDLEIQDAIRRVEETISVIEGRAEQLVRNLIGQGLYLNLVFELVNTLDNSIAREYALICQNLVECFRDCLTANSNFFDRIG